MKAWKIIAVTAFAFIAVALITASALVYTAAGQGMSGLYGSNGAAQGSKGGMMRGPMGCGYSQYGIYTSSSGYPQQYGSCTGGCGMRNGLP
jgi:hypothetical protein